MSEELRRILDMDGAVAYLGIGHKIIRRLVREGHLPRVTLAKKYLFDMQDLDKLIESEKKVAPIVAPADRGKKATEGNEKPFKWAEKYGVRR